MIAIDLNGDYNTHREEENFGTCGDVIEVANGIRQV